jgi:hypothetical protein
MRGTWGLVGLVLVMAIVAVLARKQLSVMGATAPAAPLSTEVGATPAVTSPDSSRTLQEHVKQQVQTQMQARPMPDSEP